MPIFADTGLPMIAIELPFLLMALLPVVVLEAAVYRVGLPQLKFTEALKGSLVANLFSTLLGVPIAWGLLLVPDIALGGGAAWGLDTPLLRLAAVTVQAPWLIPYEEDFYWMIPAASLFLMLPFFLASVLTEWLVLRKLWPKVDRRRLTRLVWLANGLSYAGLAVFWAIQLALARPHTIS